MARDKRILSRRPAVNEEEEAFHREELERLARRDRYFQESGAQVGGDEPLPEPGADDAVAHLKSMPPEQAIQKARAWTGRTDITTLAEAIAAVRAALGGE